MSSNQNAGEDRKPCTWCSLWQVAFSASRIDAEWFVGNFGWMSERLRQSGDRLLLRLANRETDCPGCLRSAEIQRGNVLGDQQAAWRAAMWRDNPVMRQFMRAGPGDTFEEVSE